jgi:nucleoside-triphosphatase THEP1
MKIWITGYIGSGKSTLVKKISNVFEFDNIEIILKEKGYNLKNMSNKDFKNIVSKELNSIKNTIIEGIQAPDYYKKGDKVYFVKTNFLKSIKRCYQRDGIKKLWSNLKDNIVLIFKLKILYIKTLLNKDLIKNINAIKK